MWTIIPRTATNGFASCKFPLQLPVDEHNLRHWTLYGFTQRKGAPKRLSNNWNRLRHKVKLRKMRAALYTAKGEPINVEALKQSMQPRWQIPTLWKSNWKIFNASSVALKDAVRSHLGYSRPAVPSLPTLSGQGIFIEFICHHTEATELIRLAMVRPSWTPSHMRVLSEQP